MEPFFQTSYKALVESPNGASLWWHSLPLPDGNRVNGHNPDKDLQFKMWRAMQIPEAGGLAHKRVLDVGANDGFFTVAAVMAGARAVTAVDMEWSTWPMNIDYACRTWKVDPEIVSGDFMTHGLAGVYDVISRTSLDPSQRRSPASARPLSSSVDSNGRSTAISRRLTGSQGPKPGVSRYATKRPSADTRGRKARPVSDVSCSS